MRFRIREDGSWELRRGKVVQAALAFRIEGESSKLSAEGGLALTDDLSHLGFWIPKTPSSGSEGKEGWGECWELSGSGRKRKRVRRILSLACQDIRTRGGRLVKSSRSVRCYWEPKGGGTILFTRLVTTWLSRNDRVSSSSTTTEYRWGGLLGSPAETFGHKFRGPSEKCSGGR